MVIKTLVENTSISKEYKCEHGLSLYIETKKHKLLFDLGADKLFLENADEMGVKLEDVDTVIISHGHRDHGGALKLFLEKNHKAKVYIRENAFEKHTTKLLGLHFDCGLDDSLAGHPQIVFTKERIVIDDELQLFSDIKTRECCSASNKALFASRDGKIGLDEFTHEQNLIITENGKNVMICGCSHKGIVNIVNRASELLGREPEICIGGFHLYNPVSKKQESGLLVKEIAARLSAFDTKFYTCHCTGQTAYGNMREILQDKLGYLATGAVLEV